MVDKSSLDKKGILTNFYKIKRNILGKEKIVVVMNHKQKDEVIEVVKKVDQIHHIHILDRSGSMSSEIVQLIENVKKTIEFIDQDDYISIIWFSGPGHYRTLLKGFKKDNKINDLLDTIKSTLDTTCFSEPLKEANVIIDELKAVCPNFSINFFTDGQTVTPWSQQEEEKRIFAELSILKAKVLALNTIGYGNYYNRELLLNMSKETEFGEFIHSSKIEEYRSIFEKNYEKVVSLTAEPLSIVAPAGVEIIYLSSKFSKLVEAILDINRIDKHKNQVMMISDNDFEFNYNKDTNIHTSEIKEAKIRDNTFTNLMYAYAYNLFNDGNRHLAKIILANECKDKYFVDKSQNVYTYDEVGNFLNELNKALFNVPSRYKDGECPENYLPKEDAFCLLDLLTILGSQNKNYFLAPKNYNKIGRAVTDTFNLFKANKVQDISMLLPIGDLTYNKDFFNISTLLTIHGTVSLNPKAAKSVGLEDTINSKIFRNFSIVKDGSLNLKSIEVLTHVDTLKSIDAICKRGFYEVSNIDPAEFTGENISDYLLVKYNIDALPLINMKYMKGSMLPVIANNVVKMNKLEVKQKVLNYYRDLVISTSKRTVKEDAYKAYTVNQIEVLKEHGLDSKLNYVGVANEMAAKVDSDFYEAKILSFSLKGWSAIPAIKEVMDRVEENKVIEKENDALLFSNPKAKTKKLKLINEPSQMVLDCYNELMAYLSSKGLTTTSYSKKLLDEIDELIYKNKSELVNLRNNNFQIRLSMLLIGNWFSSSEIINEDGKLSYKYIEVASNKDYIINIKVDKEKKFI